MGQKMGQFHFWGNGLGHLLGHSISFFGTRFGARFGVPFGGTFCSPLPIPLPSPPNHQPFLALISPPTHAPTHKPISSTSHPSPSSPPPPTVASFCKRGQSLISRIIVKCCVSTPAESIIGKVPAKSTGAGAKKTSDKIKK